MRKSGHSPVVYPLLKVGHLSSFKDVTPNHLRCGVYRAVCNAPGCGATYIGQSGRTMGDRITRHQATFENLQETKSAIAKHCLSANYHFSLVSFRLIHTATKGRLLNGLEMVETVAICNTAGINVLNDLSFEYVNPLVTYMYKHDVDDDMTNCV